MIAPLNSTHAGGVVRVNLSGCAWSAVPIAFLENKTINLTARVVGAWLVGRPDGWQISISHMLRALGIGKDAWQRAARELEEAGFLTRACAPTGPGGRMVWNITFSPVHKQESFSSTVAGFTGSGSAVAGSAVAGQTGNLVIREEKEESNKKERVHAPRAPRGGTPRNSLKVRELEIDETTGIHHNPLDQRDVSAMSRIITFSPSLIDRAVETAKNQDPAGRAFPSIVLRLLLKPRPSSVEQAAPAWATAGRRSAGGERRGEVIIDGEAKWTD